MMGVWLRSIRKEYAAVCNHCGKMECVFIHYREGAISHFRKKGWKIDTMTLCPECRKKGADE